MNPKRFLASLLLVVAITLLPRISSAADAQSKVLEDIQRFVEPSRLIYNDLDRGIAEAKKTNKPLLVIFRCVPCIACSAFDKRVLEKDNEIVDLLDLFVCVRIIHGNGMDLSLFQFDYDQSFHVFFLNPDKTIYGQFGTRSFRKEEEDMTMEAMRKAMLGALELHSRFPEVKASLAAKRGPAPTVAHPENYPNLQGKFDAKLSTEGNVAKSCIHCHQIRESDRLTYRNTGKPIPDEVLYPYPLPDVLGMRFNPKERATLATVEDGSIASRAALQSGDKLISLNGQPLLSIADVQWVLQTTGPTATLKAEIERDGKRQSKSLTLPAGWRHGDISWRVTTWDLRRMVLGGVVLEPLPDAERQKLDLAKTSLALRVKYVGQYNEHAAAKKAGFQLGDVIVGVDGQRAPLTESQLIATTLARSKGTSVPFQIRRGDQSLELSMPMQ